MVAVRICRCQTLPGEQPGKEPFRGKTNFRVHAVSDGSRSCAAAQKGEAGKLHQIAKAEIEEREFLGKSTMPEGIEKRFTDREFLDLLAFLLSEKRPAPR